MTTLRGIAQLSDCLLTHMLLAYWRKLLSMPGCLYPSKPKYTVTSCPIHASGICSAIDSPLYACSAILPDRGRKPLEAILAALGARSMHDPASGLRRIYLLRTRVNKGNKRKGQSPLGPRPRFRGLAIAASGALATRPTRPGHCP